MFRELGGGLALALAGGSLSADDQRVLNVFAAQLAAAAESQRLQDEAGKATELAHANDLRAALLQAVSHDLRTPLAAIKAAISSLRQEEIDWPPETRAEFEATIESETDRLSALVGNLLDMSRLQASAVNVDLRPTGVEEIVIGAVSSLGFKGPAVEIDVDETLPPVAADAALLERALANLIANAAAASPLGVPPRVTAGEVAAGADHRIDICVIDSGPGIRLGRPGARLPAVPAVQRPRWSHRGRRTRPGDRPWLRRGDGWRARRRRHAGRGDDDDRQPPARRSLGDERARVTRVLVVDDEAPIRRALAANLKARGYDVDTAETGEQALDLAARHHPDVVLLDLGLPGIDGLEVIDGLRGWTHVPIVVLSARGAERDKVAALDAGADDYVAKPFGMDELLARLRAAVRRATPADEEPVVTHRRLHGRPHGEAGARSGGRTGTADPDGVAAARGARA